MASGSRRFLRDNAFLVAAAALPLVVVAFFQLSTAVPRWSVPDPAYDLLFRAEGGYDGRPGNVAVDFTVRDGRVEATARPIPPNSYRPPATLFRFHHETLTVTEVPLDLPDSLEEGDSPRTIVVDALAGRRVVAQPSAPDGYRFENRSRQGPGLVGELFGINRYRASAALVNDGRVVPIELPADRSYPGAVHAVGWIVDDGQR